MEVQIKKTIDVKLNVRPVTLGMYHEYVFEGPCRFVTGDKLKKEFDLKANAEAHKMIVEGVKAALPVDEVNIMAPILIQYDESFFIKESDLADMAKDVENVDLYLISALAVGDILLEFAQKYKKPMIVMGGCLNTIATAALLSRGYEIYPCETLADAAETMKVLRARKALAETKVLSLVRLNSNNAPAIMDSFISLDEVTRKFGTRFRYYNVHEFVDQMRNVPSDTNPTIPGRRGLNITDEDEVAIKKMADEFIAGAVECDMTRENVLPSMRAHYLVQKLLKELDCNAFTSPCFDVCATRRFNEEKFTFCLNHTLNNENGVISSCEYDMCSVLSMVALSCFAKAPPYLGNCIPNPFKSGVLQAFSRLMFNPDSVQKAMDELGHMDNLVFTFHAVPNRKLKGFDKSHDPYAIRPFTGSGWGATVRYDFKADIGQEITMCRFGPDCKKLFVGKGKIVGGIGYTDINCSEGVFFQVENSKDFFEKISLVGNHNPLVYGDHVDQMVALGKILGLEVITA
ncbi:MAG: fucose isomerase [Deltaproteobacteria bacterium]|nr:fucose isomerase [Deltaproteobacteria bacterium]